MTSKERVKRAMAHEEADRVPVDYLANPGIDARLKQQFGLRPDDDESLRQRLGVDYFEIIPRYIGPRLHPDLEGRKTDMWGIRTRWVAHEDGGYWDYCDFPLKNADEEGVASWPMPSPDDFDYERIPHQCLEREGYALLIGNPGAGDMINTAGMIRTMEQVLVDLTMDEPAGLLFMDRKNDVQLEVLRRSLEAAEGAIDILWLGEDLGTQRGPLISLELFRRHIRPRHQKFVDLAREFGIPVMMHSCGSSSWAFDDFLEMGITIVDTLQPEAKDMSPAHLKDTFGDRLSFHGCISTAGPVAYGTVEDTERNVRETLEVMMPGGGYAFSPTHMLQDNSPAENVVAMYDAVHRFGSY
ncbi:MAG: uroporphyrinogen decarboxylase family protein [Bacteroidota bacterium]